MPEICLVIVVQSAFSHFGAFQVEILQMYYIHIYIYIRIIILLMLDVCTFISPATTFIELDDGNGNIYRKPLYLMVKTMVSCRFLPVEYSLSIVGFWFQTYSSSTTLRLHTKQKHTITVHASHVYVYIHVLYMRNTNGFLKANNYY